MGDASSATNLFLDFSPFMGACRSLAVNIGTPQGLLDWELFNVLEWLHDLIDWWQLLMGLSLAVAKWKRIDPMLGIEVHL